MEERHLSLSEAADVLGISERTAYRWIKSGKLRAYKPGRDYRIPESAIRELMERSEAYPKGQSPLPFDQPTVDPGMWRHHAECVAGSLEELVAEAGEVTPETRRGWRPLVGVAGCTLAVFEVIVAAYQVGSIYAPRAEMIPLLKAGSRLVRATVRVDELSAPQPPEGPFIITEEQRQQLESTLMEARFQQIIEGFELSVEEEAVLA